MHKLVILVGLLAACGSNDSKGSGKAVPGGKTLAELAATADAPDDLKTAVPAPVIVGRPLSVTVINPDKPHGIQIDTCHPGEPADVFVPLGDWVKAEHKGAFSVTGTIDIQAHWKGGEIRGYSDRGNGCEANEFHARFTIYRSND